MTQVLRLKKSKLHLAACAVLSLQLAACGGGSTTAATTTDTTTTASPIVPTTATADTSISGIITTGFVDADGARRRRSPSSTAWS